MYRTHIIQKTVWNHYRHNTQRVLSTLSSTNQLTVKNRIDDKRKSSLLGGGLKRIEQQHKKVLGLIFFIKNNLIDFFPN